MKYIIIFLLISSSLFSQDYSLDVGNGHGNGTYPKGIDVNVWANQNLDTLVFSHWTGSAVQFLDNTKNWHSIVNVPVENTFTKLTLFANYIEIDRRSKLNIGVIPTPALDEGIDIPNYNRIVLSAKPDSVEGILFIFQDKNITAQEFANNFELRHLTQDAYARNLLVILTNSNEMTHGDQDSDSLQTWRFDDDYQIDKVIIKTIINDFVVNDTLSQNLPLYLLGYRLGANFVQNISMELEAKSEGLYFLEKITNRVEVIPKFYLMAENYNDELRDLIYSEYIVSLQKSKNNLFTIHNNQPLYRHRFLRNTTGIDTNTSFELFNVFKNTDSLLDENNYFNFSSIDSFPEFDITDVNLNNLQEKQFTNQVNILLGRNFFTADYNKSLLDFFISNKDYEIKRYNLMVINGYGEGTYPAGDTVHIWANLGEEVFTQWTGDTNYVEYYKAHQNAFIMPEIDLVLKANHIEKPNFEFENITSINDFNFDYFFPDSMKAITFMLNDNGELDNTWQNDFERMNFINKLILNNYGVVIPYSTSKNIWDTGTKDFNTIQAFYEYLVSANKMDKNTQVNVIAYGEATNYINYFTNILHYNFLNKVSTIININGAGNSVFYIKNFPNQMPALWLTSQAHNNSDVSLFDNIKTNYQNNLDREQNSELWTNNPSPVYSEMFERIEGIDMALSNQIFNTLNEIKLLDDKGYYQFNSFKFSKFSDSMSANNIPISDITSLLNMSISAKEINSNYSKYIIDFLDANIDSTNSDTLSVYKTDDEIIIYPNIVDDFFSIQIKEKVRINNINIYSSDGKLIKKFNKFSIANLIDNGFDISNLSTGLYFIEINLGEHTYLKKIIKV